VMAQTADVVQASCFTMARTVMRRLLSSDDFNQVSLNLGRVRRSVTSDFRKFFVACWSKSS
jgi:hypothetical protein